MLQFVDFRLQVCFGNRLKLHLLLLSLFLGSSLLSQEIFTDLEGSIFPKHWINVIIDSGDAHSGQHYSIADSLNPYGLGLESRFPEDMRGKNCMTHYGGWVKSNEAFDQAVFVFTLQKNGDVLYWKDGKLKPRISEANTWFYFSDSLLVPAGITNTGQIKAYLWNNDRQDTIAIDDLRFHFKPILNSTYLPDVGSFVIREAEPTAQLLSSNNYYSIYYDDEIKSLSVYSRAGEQLITNIWYHDQRRSDEIERSGNLPLSLKKISAQKDLTRLTFAVNRSDLKLTVELHCRKNSPKIEILVEEKYRSGQRVARESLVMQSSKDVQEVFRKSRKSDVDDFQSEYWLGKQGAQFGDKNDSWVIYHQPEISSMQLDAENKQLWINLDYKKDHPFLHFPFKNDSIDFKEDWSESVYAKSGKRSFSFSIIAGTNVTHLPRLMKNPNGYLATYIWTEHADFTDITTNRAVYYGSETINRPDSAIGGFGKHGIPVTKSVFYSNPAGTTNDEISGGTFSGLESTIKDDTAFSSFLDQLHKNGHEICLHTPEQFTSNKERMTEALHYMKSNFETSTWIDHGYNNKDHNNREDLVCDGVIKKSSNFSLDLWEEFNISYFWNPYFEDFPTYTNWQFGQLLGKPYHGFGDAFPNPDYWQHPTITRNLYHWPTRSVIYPDSDAKWDFHFNNAILNDLVDGWSLEINHCYPAWVDPEKGFWDYGPNGEIIARKGFDDALSRMASLRAQGLLNILTIKDYLDYQTDLEGILYEYQPDGRIKVTNPGDRDIKGLSFATKGRWVQVNDRQPVQKKLDDDIIFWFYLGAKQSKLIRILD